MTDKRQSDALRLADELEDSLESHDGSSLTARCQGIADDAAAELRSQYAELETLRAGYAAARLEVESLKAQLAERASHGQAPAQAVPAAVAGPSGYGPNVTVRRSCSDCKACNSESYAVQGDSGHYVYCEHPSLPESKYIGDTNWNTPHWCPVSAPTTQPASQREPAEIDTATMVLAESVGLIGPASRTHDLHGAIQRFHDLICANATIKAAQMAAEAISAAAPQPSPTAQAADSVQEDAAELDFLKSDLLSCVQTVVGNGGAHHIIEDAYERYEAWLAAQEGK